MTPRDLLPGRFFLDAWRGLDDEVARHRASGGGGGAGRALFIFTVVAVSLTLQEYFGGPQTLLDFLSFIDDPLSPEKSPFLFALVSWMKPEDGTSLYLQLVRSEYYELWNLGYWASWRVLGFFVIPFIAVLANPRLKMSETGLSTKGFFKHLWVYGVLFVPVLVAVIIVSFTEEFSTYYPFYSEAHRALFDFVVWETFYIAQFLSLEFFFRGFMIQPLRKYLGSSVIFAMMIPYVMIHFGKPLPECFAAIIAGVVLGTLAMRTRSIWAGFLIHVSVALSMDLAAIWQVHWR